MWGKVHKSRFFQLFNENNLVGEGPDAVAISTIVLTGKAIAMEGQHALLQKVTE
jgi:hypothetical protein